MVKACHFTESIPSFPGCLLSAVCEEGCLVTPSESVKGEKRLRLNWTDTLANIVNREVPKVFSSTKGNPKFRKLNLAKCCHRDHYNIGVSCAYHYLSESLVGSVSHMQQEPCVGLFMSIWRQVSDVVFFHC